VIKLLHHLCSPSVGHISDPYMLQNNSELRTCISFRILSDPIMWKQLRLKTPWMRWSPNRRIWRGFVITN